MASIPYLFMLWATAMSAVGAQAVTVPMADAGSSRYAGYDPIMLDGSASFDPADANAMLSYRWTQIAGPSLNLSDANTATPTVSGFLPGPVHQTCRFELIVNNGSTDSQPDAVEVTIVEDYGDIEFTLVNPPFNPEQPTLIGFGGGNCISGRDTPAENWPHWVGTMNLLSTVYEPPYHLYAEWIIAYLSRVAPDYDQYIMTRGGSTGGNPAVFVAHQLNTIHRDPRYNINRVILHDAPCMDYTDMVRQLNQTDINGEPFWVENGYSTSARYLSGALNIRFRTPDAAHGTPGQWYRLTHDLINWRQSDPFVDGSPGGYYTSVVGPLRHLHITDPCAYYFDWDPKGQYLKPFRPFDYPGRLPEPPRLVGPVYPAQGDRLLLTCSPCRYAVRYELLVGSDPRKVKNYTRVLDGSTPPVWDIDPTTAAGQWWTVRVFDAHGAHVYADPIPTVPTEEHAHAIVNTTTGSAYLTIQNAIDHAQSGDTLVLAPGTYHESLILRGPDITLQSQDPYNPASAQATIISGDVLNPVMTVGHAESQHRIIGLSFTAGMYGLICSDTFATVENCFMIGNIDHGLVIQGNTDVRFDGCTIAGNGGHGVSIDLASSRSFKGNGDMSHCVIAGNARRGIHGNLINLDHCTIAENTWEGLRTEKGSITNSIFYWNGRASHGTQVTPHNLVLHHCSVQGGWPGNQDLPPVFARLGLIPLANDDYRYELGDYHLQSQSGRWDPASQTWPQDKLTSACIDAADPAADWSHEPSPHGNRANLGAYGNTKEASRSLGNL